MIDGIRRKLTSLDDESDWDANLDLQPEAEAITEISTGNSNLLSASRVTGKFSPDSNTSDYYAGVVRAAIAQGGRYGGHQISLPWLRLILAGLEWRNVEPELLWNGQDSVLPTEPISPNLPSYDHIFPSEGT
jgi:hypothetical protein